MVEALLVIDVQNGIVDYGDFSRELIYIERVIEDFEENNKPVIFVRHLDDEEESPLYKHGRGAEIHPSIRKHADVVVEKKTPSAFYHTNLSEILHERSIEHVYIVGFNTEFCCMFTAIAAFDRGYEVTFIEDATGTVGDEEAYEMPGLDIRDFVGTVLHWSGQIEVLDYEEYVEEQNN